MPKQPHKNHHPARARRTEQDGGTGTPGGKATAIATKASTMPKQPHKNHHPARARRTEQDGGTGTPGGKATAPNKGRRTTKSEHRAAPKPATGRQSARTASVRCPGTKGRPGREAFLPVSRADMEARGWDQCDFVYICGDAYVDHPSFGMAIISRVLEHAGYRVGIICQPDWTDPASIAALGGRRGAGTSATSSTSAVTPMWTTRASAWRSSPACSSMRATA